MRSKVIWRMAWSVLICAAIILLGFIVSWWTDDTDNCNFYVVDSCKVAEVVKKLKFKRNNVKTNCCESGRELKIRCFPLVFILFGVEFAIFRV